MRLEEQNNENEFSTAPPPSNKKHMKLIINSRQFVTKRNVFPKLIKTHSLSSAPKLAGKLLFRQNNVGFDIYICKLLAMFTKCCEHLPQIRTQIGFDGHDAVLSFCNAFFFTTRYRNLYGRVRDSPFRLDLGFGNFKLTLKKCVCIWKIWVRIIKRNKQCSDHIRGSMWNLSAECNCSGGRRAKKLPFAWRAVTKDWGGNLSRDLFLGTITLMLIPIYCEKCTLCAP